MASLLELQQLVTANISINLKEVLRSRSTVRRNDPLVLSEITSVAASNPISKYFPINIVALLSSEMILLPGEGIDNASISVSCPNCTEEVFVPSGSVRKLVKVLDTRKIDSESDNLPFKYHHTAVTDKRNMQARELFFLRLALDETEDLKEYTELTRRYIKKQRMYLSTLQEAASVYRNVGALIEETTAKYFTIVNRALQRNSWLDGDMLDMRARCENLRTEKKDIERYRDAVIKMSQVYKMRYFNC